MERKKSEINFVANVRQVFAGIRWKKKEKSNWNLEENVCLAFRIRSGKFDISKLKCLLQVSEKKRFSFKVDSYLEVKEVKEKLKLYSHKGKI